MTEIRTAIPDDIDRYLDSLVRTGPFASKAELVRAALMAFAGAAGPMPRGFDRENVLAPDGRIYQLEYAREASLRGLPGVGVTYKGGIVLASPTSPRPKLTKAVAKMYAIGDRVALLASGLVADAYVAASLVRRVKPKTTRDLVDHIVRFYWEHTIDRTKRPLGAALLVATTLGGTPRLFQFDPSGAFIEADAAAVGDGHEKALERLEEGYGPLKEKEAERLALEALGTPETYELLRVRV
jgi:20S proteasome alpha/beta subunit